MASLSNYTNLNMEIPYVAVEAVVISGGHVFSRGAVRGLLITATGNVVIVMEDDGSTITIPVVVAAGHFIELRGYYIRSITETGTTATVLCGMY